MLKVTENKKTNSHVLSVLGLAVGFDDVDWIGGGLVLLFKDSAVASIDGEMLEAFRDNEYVKENIIGE